MTIQIIARNKRASYEYSLIAKVEAGIVLKGTEIKSIRNGRVNISDAYVTVDDYGEVYIYNMNISHYEFGNRENHQENRFRKLLLHKKEIAKLKQAIKSKGMTVVPLAIYIKKTVAKIEIALARGKKLYDKRQDERKKDSLKEAYHE
ncbi:MAG: SsrA-binding protein SmpB [Oligoflexia bacterium]|nr:SsrA-binding protein SmpB [Oligoflexia bacterium]